MQVRRPEPTFAREGAEVSEAEDDRGPQADRDEQAGRRRHLVALHPGQEGLDGPAHRVPEGGEGRGPEQTGQEVGGEERGRPHAEGATGGGDRDAQAVREAAGQEEERASAADEVQEPAKPRVAAVAGFEPAPAAAAGEGEVREVGESVGGDRDQEDRGPGEDAAASQEGGDEQDRLALHQHPAEEQRVAVLEEQDFHGWSP